MPPIVVAHVVESSFGGIRTFVHRMLESQIEDTGIREVHLLADPRAVGDLASIPGIKVHFYDSSRAPLDLAFVGGKVRKILSGISPHVVVAHSTFPGLYLRSGFQRPSWPLVYCAHGWSFCQDIGPMKRKLYALVERRLARRTTAIINISSDEHRAAMEAGISAPIHVTIRNGVAEPSSSGSTPRMNPDRVNFGFVGRFDRQKGVDVLLKLFSDPRLDGADLWMIGGNVRDDNPIEIPKRHNIHQLGWVPATEIDAHMRGFDALVVPSRWEGFGLVSLEAMRNAKPVIANRVGGLAEIITPGHDGMFMDISAPDSCVNMLARLDKAELARMGRNAIDTFRSKYLWETCYSQWRSAITQACAIKQAYPHA